MPEWWRPNGSFVLDREGEPAVGTFGDLGGEDGQLGKVAARHREPSDGTVGDDLGGTGTIGAEAGIGGAGDGDLLELHRGRGQCEIGG